MIRRYIFFGLFVFFILGSQLAFGPLPFGRGGQIGSAPPGPGTTLMTRAIINDSSSTMAAGSPTKPFGQIFKDGDVCGSDAPQFLDGATPQPFSASPPNWRRYYPSGCLLFASFMIRPTNSVAGNSSRPLTIKNGGTWPTMGTGTAGQARTLSEVYTQNLKVNLPAVSAGIKSANAFLGANVTLGSWLNGDANQYRTVKWLDGNAGTCWWADTHASQSQGGAADNEIQVAHYVCGLTNSGGAIGGFRWNAEIRAPDYTSGCLPDSCVRAFASPDNATPANGVNWQLGSATPTPIQWPYAAQTVTTSGCSTNICTTTPNNYWTGAGGPGNFLPGYFTSGFGNYSTNKILFALAYTFNTTNLDIYDAPQFANSSNSVGPGTSGTATFNPLFVVYPFTSYFFANSNGEDQFFQGTGSLSADATTRITIDQAYWQKAGLFPPWDLSLCGSNPTVMCPGGAGVVTDSTWNLPYTPYSIAGTLADMSNAGDHADIGIVMNSSVVDFYNQSVNSRKAALIGGYAGTKLALDFEDGTTHGAPNFTGGTYSGIPTFNDVGWAAGGNIGSFINRNFSNPTTIQVGSAMGVLPSFDHRPEYAAWPYVLTGQPQFLRILIRQGIGGILGRGGERTSNVSCGGCSAWVPYTKGGLATAWNIQFRQMAWDSRDVQFSAMFVPFDPNNPSAVTYDGSQLATYLNEMADNDANYPMDMYNLSAPYGAETAYIKSRGLWSPVLWFSDSTCPSGAPFQTPAPPCYQRDGPEWQKSMVVTAMALAAARGNANAKQFIQLFAKNWKYIIDTFGGYSLYGFYERNGRSESSAANAHTTSHMIAADNQYAISEISALSGGPFISWTNTGSLYWTMNGTPNNGYSIHNGDTFLPYATSLSAECHPSNMLLNEPYHVGNLSGANFNLYDHNNTLFVPVDTSASMGACGAYFNVDYMPAFGTAPSNNWPYNPAYPQAINMAANWGKADGNGNVQNGLNQTATDAIFRLSNTTGCTGLCGPGGTFLTYYNSSSIVGESVDVRYATQNHRGP